MEDKLHEIRVFENFPEELFETGHVIVTTKVVEKSHQLLMLIGGISVYAL